MLYLDPGEHVIFEVRKHWFVFFSQACFYVFAAIAPFFLYEAIVKLVPALVSYASGANGLVTFLYLLWLMLVWISFFVQWTKYYLQVWYVTEKRIIDVDQKGLFSRTVSNLRFDKIQDITVEVHGFVSTLLNIGDIKVQTAAEDSGDFLMRMASQPDKVRSFIFSQHNSVSEKFVPSNNGFVVGKKIESDASNREKSENI